MTVHVGEMHTDVLPASTSTAASPSTGQVQSGADTEDSRWLQSRGRAEWLARRTAAEGFDD
jgi:hypothetical protein